MQNIAIVTGSRKGIGLEITKFLLKNNYIVIGCSRKESLLKDSNYKHFAIDLNNEKDVLSMFSYCRKNYHRLDVLVNNVGIASMNHLLLMPTQSVRKILDTNFVTTFLCTREASKLMMLHKYGRIINFSTIATAIGLEGEAVYASSKMAIEKFTQISAKELASYNITVNCIAPSPVETDLIKNIHQEKIDMIIDQQIIKRYTTFTDINNVVKFFIDKNSDFISGQTIHLGGN